MSVLVYIPTVTCPKCGNDKVHPNVLGIHLAAHESEDLMNSALPSYRTLQQSIHYFVYMQQVKMMSSSGFKVKYGPVTNNKQCTSFS